MTSAGSTTASIHDAWNGNLIKIFSSYRDLVVEVDFGGSTLQAVKLARQHLLLPVELRVLHVIHLRL